jgi:hypothetical protein
MTYEVGDIIKMKSYYSFTTKDEYFIIVQIEEDFFKYGGYHGGYQKYYLKLLGQIGSIHTYTRDNLFEKFS